MRTRATSGPGKWHASAVSAYRCSMTDLLVRRAAAVFGHDIDGEAALIVRDGKVDAVIADCDLPGGLGDLPELDAAGRAVIPGFVDAHTHLVFAGDRGREFAARLAGKPYEAGGIMATVVKTRAAT